MAAKSSQVINAFAVQVDKDTPVTAAPFTVLNRRSGGFTSTVADIEEGTITDTLLASATLPGRKTHAASFEVTFKELLYDDFLRSAYAAQFIGDGTNDVLTMGKEPVYINFVTQTDYLVDNTRHFVSYTGCQVQSIAFTLPQDGVIGMTMEIQAANKTPLTAAPWSVLNQPATKNALRTCTSLREVRIDAVDIPSVIETVNYTIARANSEIFDVRQCDASEVILGEATVSGNINAYHDDASDQWHRDADNDVKYAIDFLIQAETKAYRFNNPIANNKAAGFDSSGENVTVDLPFGAETTAPFVNRDG